MNSIIKMTLLGALFYAPLLLSGRCIQCQGSGMMNRLNSYFIDGVPYSNFELCQCYMCHGTGEEPEPWGGSCSQQTNADSPNLVQADWNFGEFNLYDRPLISEPSPWDNVNPYFDNKACEDISSKPESSSSLSGLVSDCCSCFFPYYFRNYHWD